MNDFPFDAVSLIERATMAEDVCDRMPYRIVGLESSGVTHVHNETESRPAGLEAQSVMGSSFFDAIARYTGGIAVREAPCPDDAVQVGGTDIFPAAVATLLRAHARVAEASVRLGSNGRLTALPVPKDAACADTLIETVADYLADRLPAAARPAAYTIGTVIPLGPLGTALDWQ